jgi:hypothetical protein
MPGGPLLAACAHVLTRVDRQGGVRRELQSGLKLMSRHTKLRASVQSRIRMYGKRG